MPTKLIIEKSEPAKFGAKSCEFCKLVTVAAPLKPRDNVMIAMQAWTLNPTKQSAINSTPGMM